MPIKLYFTTFAGRYMMLKKHLRDTFGSRPFTYAAQFYPCFCKIGEKWGLLRRFLCICTVYSTCFIKALDFCRKMCYYI